MDHINSLVISTKFIPIGKEMYEFVEIEKRRPRLSFAPPNPAAPRQAPPGASEKKPAPNKRRKRIPTARRPKKAPAPAHPPATLRISRVLTVYSPASLAVPSTELFFTEVPQGDLVLVQWANYSISEATWVLPSELTARFDPDGLYRRFVEAHGVCGRVVAPLLGEAVPAATLVPTKIVGTTSVGENVQMYRVKWGVSGNVFVSEETEAFFGLRRNRRVLAAYELRGGAFPWSLTADEARLADALVRNYGEGVNTIVAGRWGKRTAVLAFLNRVVNESVGKAPKPHIIITEPARVGYYQAALPRLVPGYPVTYVTGPTGNEQLVALQNAELYRENQLAPQVVVLSFLDFEFRSGFAFDTVIVDAQAPETIAKCGKYTDGHRNIVAVVNGEGAVGPIKTVFQACSKHRTATVSASGSAPRVGHVYVVARCAGKQQELCKRARAGAGAEAEEVRRLLNYPPAASVRSTLRGFKIRAVQRLVPLVQAAGRKAAVVSPFPRLLEHVADAFSCNVIGWETDADRSGAICGVLRGGAAGAGVRANDWLVCVDWNAADENVDLSMVDFVFVVSGSGHESVDGLRRFQVGAVKDVRVVHIVGEGTAEDVLPGAASAGGSSTLSGVKEVVDAREFVGRVEASERVCVVEVRREKERAKERDGVCDADEVKSVCVPDGECGASGDGARDEVRKRAAPECVGTPKKRRSIPGRDVELVDEKLRNEGVSAVFVEEVRRGMLRCMERFGDDVERWPAHVTCTRIEQTSLAVRNTVRYVRTLGLYKEIQRKAAGYVSVGEILGRLGGAGVSVLEAVSDLLILNDALDDAPDRGSSVSPVLVCVLEQLGHRDVESQERYVTKRLQRLGVK